MFFNSKQLPLIRESGKIRLPRGDRPEERVSTSGSPILVDNHTRPHYGAEQIDTGSKLKRAKIEGLANHVPIPENHFTYKLGIEGETMLLPTCLLYFQSRSNNIDTVSIRTLLDNCSQRSFITVEGLCNLSINLLGENH